VPHARKSLSNDIWGGEKKKREEDMRFGTWNMWSLCSPRLLHSYRDLAKNNLIFSGPTEHQICKRGNENY